MQGKNDGAIAQALIKASEAAGGSDAAKIVADVISHDAPATIENGRAPDVAGVVEPSLDFSATEIPALTEPVKEVTATETGEGETSHTISLQFAQPVANSETEEFINAVSDPSTVMVLNKDGSATLTTRNEDGSATVRQFSKADVAEALAERTKRKRVMDDEETDHIARIMQDLAEAVLNKYGMVKIGEADVFHLLTERQMLNDYIKELFEALGVPVHFLQVITKGVRTAFGRKVIDMPSMGQACRQAIALFKTAQETAERAVSEKNRMETHYNAEISNAEAASRQARLTLEAATRERAAIQSEIDSFNMPSDEKPFLLRGHYTVVKKGFGGKETESKRRVVYIGVKKGAKKKGEYYLSKDLFATAKLAEALRMETTKEALEYLGRLRKKMEADALNPESGITQKKLNALAITRISFDAMNVGNK